MHTAQERSQSVPLISATVLCTILGAAGGSACWAVGATGSLSGALFVVVGALYGLAFAPLAWQRTFNPGAGLLWGLGYALLLWLLVPAGLQPVLQSGSPMGMRVSARAYFPELVAYLLFFGVPLGLGMGLWGWRRPSALRKPFNLPRAVVTGSVGGLIGGWIFSQWMSSTNFFPLIAGLVGSNSRDLGVVLHFGIAVVIGVSFGLLFQPALSGYGSSLSWGLAYGLFWWFLGPLTLLPLLGGKIPEWSAEHATTLFGSLVGHVMYGLLLGLVCALLDRLWVAFFIEGDPINREPEGPGTRTLHSLSWGAGASVVGALLFALVELATGALAQVAALVGSTSTSFGFVLTVGIGIIIGMTYGLLFHRQAPDVGSAITWGLVYGLIWWFIGPLTLAPVIMGNDLNTAWRIAAAQAALPLLIGHLIYGAGTGYLFWRLERRYAPWLAYDSRAAARETAKRSPVGTPAPALWFLVLGLGLILPIVLG